MGKPRLVLIDAGWFVGRNARHWSRKGSMRRAHYKWIVKPAKPNAYMFVKACRKTVFNDFQYLDLRMSQLRVSPKYGNSEVLVCYDGIKARQRRGLVQSSYKGNRSILTDSSVYDAESYEIHDLREDFAKWSINPMHPRKGWSGIYDDYKEADDLIAEKVLEAFEDDEVEDIVIFTGDSDLHQIYAWEVPEGKTLRISNVQEVISPESIEENTGVSLAQFVDWKSLNGDSSDNISGIPGLGPVKATKLISEYGTLDAMPENEFIRYEVVDSESVCATLKDYREEEGLSNYRVEKDYGYFWKSLETMKRKYLTYDEYASIESLIDPADFEQRNYHSLILSNRHLIRLPFEMPESLTLDSEV